MLLALPIYCYANGISSSRRIERATYRDVAVRYLCADTHPDHDTICAFRRNNLEAFSATFVQVLELAHEMKLLKLGCVSVDGTHIKASASKDKNVAGVVEGNAPRLTRSVRSVRGPAPWSARFGRNACAPICLTRRICAWKVDSNKPQLSPHKKNRVCPRR